MTHARRSHLCFCGKVGHGNGFTNHRVVCPKDRRVRELRAAGVRLAELEVARRFAWDGLPAAVSVVAKDPDLVVWSPASSDKDDLYLVSRLAPAITAGEAGEIGTDQVCPACDRELMTKGGVLLGCPCGWRPPAPLVRLVVDVAVLDEMRLREFAEARYAACWGHSYLAAEGKRMSLGTAVYEAMVASSANPSPDEIGIGILAGEGEVSA